MIGVSGYRSLAEMVGIYHDSVGHGGNMLLNIAPPPNSTLPDVAMDTYQGLGDFIRTCYVRHFGHKYPTFPTTFSV